MFNFVLPHKSLTRATLPLALLGLVATYTCLWSNACYASESDPIHGVRLAQNNSSSKETKKKLNAAQSGQKTNSSPVRALRRAVIQPANSNQVKDKKLMYGRPTGLRNHPGFEFPLYPGHPCITCEESGKENPENGDHHFIRFWTRDSTTQVYRFYVGILKQQGWRFLRSSTASDIHATLASKHLTVTIEYESLPAPYKGTAVAIFQSVRANAGQLTGIMPADNIDRDKDEMEKWWRGN